MTDNIQSGNAHALSYTIGLIAGEGSFFITFTRDNRYNHGVYYGPKFAVTMGAKCREMLLQQSDFYDLGTVNETQKGHQWVLSSRSDCHELRCLIDTYLDEHPDAPFLLTPKYEAYQTWCEALDLLRAKGKLTGEDVIALAELRDNINYIRAPQSITTEEIRQIVEQE